MAGVKGRSGGPRPNSGGPRANSGGRREGAGRPKRTGAPASAPAAPRAYASAEEFLRAVVDGTALADPVRVRAAQTLLRYQTAPLRTPPPQAPAKELARRSTQSIDAARNAEWEKRAAQIRARHRKGTP